MLPTNLVIASAFIFGSVYWYQAGPNASIGAACIALATGAAAPLGIPGIGIAIFGNLAAHEIRSTTPDNTNIEYRVK